MMVPSPSTAVPAPKSGGNPPPSPPDTDDAQSLSSESETATFPLPPPSTLPSVLDVDKKTPDSHVPRDSRLIRLTGVHPFNVEAPLSALFNEGFLTSPELFYVRNHGAVPEVKDEDIPDWEFSVEGLVEAPFKLSLKHLISDFDQVTYPVTLVCAGNRRKEQNVVRKSKGFSWGSAGVSTALFTGVAMSDVIRKAKPKRKARYVCMEGADKLPNGFYGTSVKLNWVMDPNRGIMLAHKMNGETLRPDHGKPLRAVIPGQIGGRSVKWLTKLIVTDAPSDNWYHIYDNRVLPTQVSPEESASNPSWWQDERYAIYDLSCNSAIAYPAHDEQLNLAETQDYYRVKGYAYGGGGRRITRVELSIDKGKTWRLADIEYTEDRYREANDADLYGGKLDVYWRETSFCWCFWNLDISIQELEAARDILVRSMDESMTIQPRDMYWSVLGMMNNPWFRVAINREENVLKFEHPVQPALMPGGWMERVKKAGGLLTNGFWGDSIGDTPPDEKPVDETADIKMTQDDVNKIISIDELRKHDDEQEPWFVVNGQVYDGTAFLNEHPGGAQSITSTAGMDATDEFMAIHSETAKAMMPKYHVGSLDSAGKTALASGENSKRTSSEPKTIFLEARNWSTAVLDSKTDVSWDTKIFTFKMDHDQQELGLPTGKHLMMRLRDPVTREAIIRSYTPTSQQNKLGYMDVLVKIYFDTPERPGGKMSQALNSIPIGHSVDFKGPIGKFEYIGRGLCAINAAQRTVKRFVMICGGSGVTPIFQVFRAVMQDSEDTTKCVVLNGNRQIEDILCRDDLDLLAQRDPQKGSIIHTLTQAPDDWSGLRGRISASLLQTHARVADESMVLICGPSAMEKSARKTLLEQGWSEEDLLVF